MSWRVEQADCVDAMRELDECSVDAIVTDPPYGLEFMGKEWDRLSPGMGRADLSDRTNFKPTKSEFKDGVGTKMGAPQKNPRCRKCGKLKFDHPKGKCRCAAPDWNTRQSEYAYLQQVWHEAWATEALRVLKPGGHLLAFGGTRTYHRLACAVEDAGFEIRDSVIWLYGSGFPKSLDVGKAINKAAGVEREVVGERRVAVDQWTEAGRQAGDEPSYPISVTAPATPEAEAWNGWGTALKPAHEPIVVARKPLIGTVAENVQAHGTGALNVDGCRIGTEERIDFAQREKGPWTSERTMEGHRYEGSWGQPREEPKSYTGRWPANVTLSHLPECETVGTRKVKGIVGGSSGGAAGLYEPGLKHKPNTNHADEDGTETVIAYNCAPGCPVAELDRQSGERPGFSSQNDHGSAQGFSDSAVYGTSEGVYSGRREGFNDTGGASRFMYVAKASRTERNAGLDSKIDECRCPRPQADIPLQRATGEATVEDGSDSSTTGSGSKPTGQSPEASKSTISTATGQTTESRTLPSSRRPSTSESTLPTSDELAMDGSGDAQSAASGSPPTPNTSTSAGGAGFSTDDADLAISPESLPTSNGANVCPDCGGVISGALRNSHPT